MNKAIAKQEETARDIAKLKGSLEKTMDNTKRGKRSLAKTNEEKIDPERETEMNERLDGEQGGKTLAKAKKK